MSNSLKEMFRTFSYRTAIKTNILSGNMSYSPISSNSMIMAGGRNSSPSSSMAGNRYLGTYYMRMAEIKDYEISELTNTVVTIFRDYIINYFNNESDIVTLSPSLKSVQDKINKIYKQLNLVNELKTHLSDILYNGAYCFKIDWDTTKASYVKFELYNPYNVVTVYKKGKIHCHLVVSRDGKILEVAPHSIVRFGSPELHLVNDMNAEYWMEESKDTLIRTYDLAAGYPLYYNVANKVKEYLLKDQVVSLLSIKDLIQPLLLLIRVDKATSPDEANRLALNTENLINKYSDISSILSANFSINDLIDSLINNIRVLPDYNSGLGSMDTIDLSKIANKINEIRGDQDNTKDSILTSLGIPRALFAGDVTKWEAIKSSQRLNSKVNNFINNIKDGLKVTTASLYYLLTGKQISLEDIDINLFTKTEVDYNIAISSSEIISNLLESINRTLDSVQNFVKGNELVDGQRYCDYVFNQLKVIDPDIMDFIDEKEVKSFIDDVVKQRKESYGSESGGYSPYGGARSFSEGGSGLLERLAEEVMKLKGFDHRKK